jgi:hypothetical protein
MRFDLLPLLFFGIFVLAAVLHGSVWDDLYAINTEIQ